MTVRNDPNSNVRSTGFSLSALFARMRMGTPLDRADSASAPAPGD